MCLPKRFLICGSALIAAIGSTPANADQPGVTIRTAPLIDPAAALAVYQSPASPAAATSADAGVSELARSLRYDIDLIYEHVRDNVGFVPIYGLQRGARGAVLDESGTAFDQAQLMVELLRDADRVDGKGYNPRYKLGRIMLTGTQFAAWFGISNADVARKVLADGGIPAIVTGTGANLTSVTMSHVWVEATIGGSTYLFDPSYKSHVRSPKINVAAISGYSRTNLLNAGSSGATYSSTSISGFNTSGFNGQLSQYRSNLENYLRTNLPGRRVGSVVGGPEILPHAAAERRRSSLPYVTTIDATWTGEIPEAYRTTITLSMATGTSSKLFADAVYGKQLRFTFGYNAGWYLTGGYSDNFSTLADACNWFTNPVSGKPYAVVSVAVNHPYAALNGAYMDRTLSKQMTGPDTNGGCTSGEFLFTLDFGAEGTRRLSELRRQAGRIALAPAPPIDLITAPTLKNIGVSFSRYVELADQQLDLVTQIHDVIGIHNIDEPWSRVNKGGGAYITWSPQRMLVVDFEAGISSNSRIDVSAARTEGAKYVAAMGLAMAESAVPRQELDSIREISPLTLVTDQDRLAAGPAQYRHYLANSANWTSVQGSLNQYTSAALSAISAYTNDGYTVLVPERGDLTPGRYEIGSGNGNIKVTTVEESSEDAQISRQAFFAFRSGGNGVDSIGLMTFDPRRGRALKGGAGVQTQSASGGPGLVKPSVPKPEAKDPIVSVLKVEPATGSITYSPPSDLRDGSGEYALEFKRSYSSQDMSDIGLGIGWSHNWKNTVSLAGDSLAAFGDKGALGAATALVAQQAAFDLAMSGSTDPRTLLAMLKTQQWLATASLNNLATVEEGLGGGVSFARMADGTFAGIEPDAGLLVQNSAPVDTMLNRLAYHPVSFIHSRPDGSTRTYTYPGIEANPDLTVEINLGRLTRKIFYMSDWTFPTGVKVATIFSREPLIDVWYFYKVSNSLGNSISAIGGVDTGEVGGSAYCEQPYQHQQPVYRPFRPGMMKYRDSALNEVQFEKTPSYKFNVSLVWLEDQGGNCGETGYLPGTYLAYAGNLIGATAPAASGQPAGPKWTYKNVVTGNGVISPLAEVYKPSNATTPGARLAYRQDGTSQDITDALNNASIYRSAPHRLDSEDPLGGQTAVYLDQLRRPVRSVDQLGRVSTTTYDDAGQVMRTVAPEGNAIEYLYDIRGNKTRECLIAKGRVAWASLPDPKVAQCNATLGDRVTTIAYVEGTALRMDQCVNLKTCNKPLYQIDPMGNRTDFAWDAARGVLLSETSGLNAAGTCAVTGGTCPVTTYAYTAFTGADGATFQLLTSKTEKISATSSTTSTYSYDTANKFALKTVTVDSGGLNLRTCGKFDATGNLISLSDPRQGVCP